jgi:hypothetical protein
MGVVARKEGRLGAVTGSRLGSRPGGILAVDEPAQPAQVRGRHWLTHPTAVFNAPIRPRQFHSSRASSACVTLKLLISQTTSGGEGDGRRSRVRSSRAICAACGKFICAGFTGRATRARRSRRSRLSWISMCRGGKRTPARGFAPGFAVPAGCPVRRHAGGSAARLGVQRGPRPVAVGATQPSQQTVSSGSIKRTWTRSNTACSSGWS